MSRDMAHALPCASSFSWVAHMLQWRIDAAIRRRGCWSCPSDQTRSKLVSQSWLIGSHDSDCRRFAYQKIFRMAEYPLPPSKKLK